MHLLIPNSQSILPLLPAPLETTSLFSMTVTLFIGFSNSSVGKESTCNAGDSGSIPGSGRYTGEGIGYPLQYSCLENSPWIEEPGRQVELFARDLSTFLRKSCKNKRSLHWTSIALGLLQSSCYWSEYKRQPKEKQVRHIERILELNKSLGQSILKPDLHLRIPIFNHNFLLLTAPNRPLQKRDSFHPLEFPRKISISKWCLNITTTY